MKPGSRIGTARVWAGGIVFAGLLVYQTAGAIRFAAVEAGKDDLSQRVRALTAREAERITEAFGSWAPLRDAIETSVPEGSAVVTLLPRNVAIGARWFQLLTVLYPRRFVPVVVDPGQDIRPALEAMVPLPAAVRDVFVLDLDARSGFPLERWCRLVIRLGGWVLWKFEGER